MRYISTTILVIVILIVPWLVIHPDQARVVYSIIESLKQQIAAVILTHSPKSVIDIKAKYAASDKSLFGDSSTKKVNILLVPGHEPDYGGAEYASIKERDMVVDLANNLREFLGKNEHYQVFVTRNKYSWDNLFSQYFTNNWNDIIAWTKGHRDEMDHLAKIGEYHPVTAEVKHNKAPANVAWRLYGISKWANESDIDIILHIHFNDNPGHGKNTPGEYSGFAIYVPQSQFYNSIASKAVAKSVFDRLKRFNAVSNLPGESSGIVESPDLIATGAYNSVDAPSVLVEYGYIYETQFNNPKLYDMAIKDLAFQTYLGLQDFFDDKNPVQNGAFGTLFVPHYWKEGANETADIYSLQTALVLEGYYPPQNRSLNDCPRTGTVGKCTKAAIEAFQQNRGIEGEKGIIGPKTLNELNKLYSISFL